MVGLTRTQEEKDALMVLLEFLVKTTKQDSRFPMLLASSDSFYHLWFEKLIGPGRLIHLSLDICPKNMLKSISNCVLSPIIESFIHRLRLQSLKKFMRFQNFSNNST